ncbi:transporter substrate-binding domain-containing protein [Liquorilactobacillus satsumensis]|uniref:Amino acid ABC superfamily ATP binding cassette transporter, binding protein n=1 Tax=Liquorilactobacillus satsumensis DSM 16230 = JCM 12392 TaxID=1423801 RepID=A0A0R1V261_9LACO|nr:transporter substrate-binding domain-containing protein [Liquorilactobacillus satsumensis]KRL96821.1 amino acid ABC superfamily ATP binding cassette transporter, binding protein [Liquorilactobacillus satsumensis DSM 16230 = JCM 12392]MCP9312981.1 transporter substrate-binding domain-containing protein [Liquorilactobacillus satsumensis]MCP9328927.1 transporter substrate-binding domain-containing protein [Liquorilactobacillus satsumensis]MCP9360137.1 transporter substrate-binding domain-contai
MSRKKWLISLGLAVICILGFIILGTKSLSHKNTLTVATSGTLYPTSYHDSNTKKLTGYDIEVIRAVAKKLHKKIVFKEYNVDGMLTAVKSGKTEVAINDFAISPARKKSYLMSTSIKHSFNSLVVRASDNSGIHSWADLKGKRSAGESGTNYQRLAEQLGAKAVNYDNVTNDVYLRDVKNGKTDFIMNDYYLQKLALKAVPNSGLKIIPNMYFTTNEDGTGEGIVINKNNKQLQKQINTALAALKKDGTLSKFAKKYYGADVTQKPTVHISKNFTLKNSYVGQ